MKTNTAIVVAAAVAGGAWLLARRSSPAPAAAPLTRYGSPTLGTSGGLLTRGAPASSQPAGAHVSPAQDLFVGPILPPGLDASQAFVGPIYNPPVSAAVTSAPWWSGLLTVG